MYETLFICAANVGRSQMAEGFYNHYKQGLYAQSAAGIQDKRLDYQFKPPLEVIRVMQERSIDISGQLIKMVSPQMIAEAETIVLLFESTLTPTLLQQYLSHKRVEYQPVEDPCPGDAKLKGEESMPSLRKTRDQIDEIVLRLLGQR